MRSGRAAEAEESVSPFENLSLAARLIGVIRQPRRTFASVAARPRPLVPLALLFAVPFALATAFYATDVGRQALVDQWERTAIAFGQPVDDARYAAWQDASERPLPYAAAVALISGPVASLVLAGVLFGLFSGLKGGTATYRQVLGVVAYAGVILIVRQVVATPVNYVRESTGNATTLGRFFAGVDETSPLARFLGLIDLFVVWWLVVLAIGLAVLYRVPTRRAATLLLGVYVGIALLLAGAMAVLGDGG